MIRADENVITALEVLNAYAGAMGTIPESGYLDVMDVVWWMTGLSPTKYDAERIPNLHAWKIVRRWPNTGEYHAGRVGG